MSEIKPDEMANTLTFWDLMEDLRSTRSRNTKKQRIKDFYKSQQPDAVYWAFRFLVKNPLESEDADMGVGKKTVRKAIEKAFNTPYDEIRDVEKEKGNLSDVFLDIEYQPGLTAMSRSPHAHQLPVLGDKVNDIAHTSGEGAKISMMAELLKNEAWPQVASFAIIGDISLGVSVKTILQALSELTEYNRVTLDRAHGIRPDVASIARDMKAGKELRTSLKPGDRFNPMLAKDASLPEGSDDWLAQWKYDGARVLIHRQEDGRGGWETRVFTRQRNEVTPNLPEVQEIVWPQTSFIFDGEAVAYDPDTGEPLPFQKIMERFQREKNIEAKRKEVEVKFKIFDALYYQGEDLTRSAFASRHQQLSACLPPELLAKTGGNVAGVYQEALDAGHEGIIAKDTRTKYQFGRDGAWRKQKPVKEPVDVEVVGVIRGTGRHSDRLGALKMATADGTYVGRVGTGFSDRDRKELWEMYQSDNLVGQIVEVKFEELQENDGQYGLRFPRYERLRPEGEADTLERIKNL